MQRGSQTNHDRSLCCTTAHKANTPLVSPQKTVLSPKIAMTIACPEPSCQDVLRTALLMMRQTKSIHKLTDHQPNLVEGLVKKPPVGVGVVCWVERLNIRVSPLSSIIR